MTAFLYYIPGPQIDPRDGKLSYAFDDKPIVRGCQKGPDGGNGHVYLDTHSDAGKVGYYADRQEWIEVPYLGCWAGFYVDDPPREAELRRKVQLKGRHIVLRGEPWLIPVARHFETLPSSNGKAMFAPVCDLPRVLKCNYETGEWCPGEVRRQYRPLWDAALRFWDIWSNGLFSDDAETNVDKEIMERLEAIPDIDRDEQENMLELVLGSNYRISRVELSLLELVATDEWGDILETITDIGGFIEHLKKNPFLQESSSTDSGLADDSPATTQPSPTG